MGKSLLDKALSSTTKRQSKVSMEDVELAIAYVMGKVNTVQISKAYGNTSKTTCVYRMAVALKRAYKEGLLAVRKENSTQWISVNRQN